MKRVLITGAAGFIGSHLAERLINEDFQITGIDNFDPFYDRSVKEQNLSVLSENDRFNFHEIDIRNYDQLSQTLKDTYDIVFHIAAKAGVRPSVANPREYQEVNVNGTQNMLEFARQRNIRQFVFASSSSVYGLNPDLPWKEDTGVLKPVSPYASTKVSGELLGHVYAHLFNIRFIALRFFTVYGARQRPDLAIHKFSRKILNNEPIPMFGDGTSLRDYTYIDDIINGVVSAMHYNGSGYEIFNLGNNQTVSLRCMIETLEQALGKKAIIEQQPEMPGDLPKTWACIEKSRRLLNYKPETDFETGIKKFAEWLEKINRQGRLS